MEYQDVEGIQKPTGAVNRYSNATISFASTILVSDR